MTMSKKMRDDFKASATKRALAIMDKAVRDCESIGATPLYEDGTGCSLRFRPYEMLEFKFNYKAKSKSAQWTYDDEVFQNLSYVVEADSFTQHTLWEDYCDRPKYKPMPVMWDWINHGISIQIGELGGLPVVVQCAVAAIEGKRMLFYDVCSQVVDYKLVDEWIDGLLKRNGRLGCRHTNATNFHLCVCEIRRKNGSG